MGFPANKYLTMDFSLPTLKVSSSCSMTPLPLFPFGFVSVLKTSAAKALKKSITSSTSNSRSKTSSETCTTPRSSRDTVAAMRRKINGS